MGLLSGNGGGAYKSVDRTHFVCTAGQTLFTISQGYAIGDIDVFMNGVRLVEGDDYYATNGTSLTLNSGAVAGDTLTIISYNQFNVANAYTKSEADIRYMVATGGNPMTSYLRTPNYGVSSWSDSATASLEASVGSGEQGVSIKAVGRSVATIGGDLRYVTDSRGASGLHRFYSWNGTSLTRLADIKSNGVLNLPSQPAMFFTGTQNTYAARVSGWVPFNNLQAGVSDGGMTSGLWTCQNQGTYLISQYSLIQTASAFEARLYKNGSTISRAYNSSGRTVSSTVVVTMNQGDYIQWYCDYDVYLNTNDQYSGLSIVKVG